jgi:hypothetical protein
VAVGSREPVAAGERKAVSGSWLRFGCECPGPLLAGSGKTARKSRNSRVGRGWKRALAEETPRSGRACRQGNTLGLKSGSRDHIKARGRRSHQGPRQRSHQRRSRPGRGVRRKVGAAPTESRGAPRSHQGGPSGAGAGSFGRFHVRLRADGARRDVTGIPGPGAKWSRRGREIADVS